MQSFFYINDRSDRTVFCLQKLLFLIVMFFFFLANTSAQNNLGIKTNLNWSNFSGEVLKTNVDEEAYNPIHGIGVGLFASHMFTLNTGVIGELYYNQIGSVYHRVNDSFNRKNEITLSYLETAVLFRYIVDRIKYLRPNLFIGPQAGFLLTATEDIKEKTLAGSVVKDVKEHDISEDYATLSYGIIFGAGVGIPMLEGYWVNVDARYYMGLADITEDERAYTKLSGFSLTLGFSISF